MEYLINSPPLADVLCNSSSAVTLYRLSATCRDAYYAVASYRRRTYNLETHFSHYFTDVISFRKLQSETGLLVSGSSVLQFLSRRTFPLSDLDLYTSSATGVQCGQWLMKNGYRFVDNGASNCDFERVYTLCLEGKYEIERAGPRDVEYHSRGIIAVFNFESRSRNRAKKIQLVVANHPLETILSFHSSVYYISLRACWDSLIPALLISMCHELRVIRWRAVPVPYADVREAGDTCLHQEPYPHRPIRPHQIR